MWHEFQKWLGIESVPTPVRQAEVKCDATDLEAIRSTFHHGRKRRPLTVEAFGQWLRLDSLNKAFQQRLYRAIGACEDGLHYQHFILALDQAHRICLELTTTDPALFISACLTWNGVEWSEEEVQSVVQGLEAQGSEAWLESFPILQKSLKAMLYGSLATT